jgi:hypothetical protein
MEPLSYLATALVLLAVYYISKPKLRGQYLILAADTTWFIYAIYTKQYALALQSAILFVIGVSAVQNWKKTGINF